MKAGILFDAVLNILQDFVAHTRMNGAQSSVDHSQSPACVETKNALFIVETIGIR